MPSNITQVDLSQYKSIAGAAAETSQNYFTLQRAIKKGAVPAVKLPGGRVGVLIEDARAFAARQRQ